METYDDVRIRAAIVLGGGMDKIKKNNQDIYEPTKQVKKRVVGQIR